MPVLPAAAAITALPDMASSAASLTTPVIAVVLFSAVLHATWNALAHGIADTLAGFTVISIGYTACCAVALPFVGLPVARAWPFILASAAVHVLYQLSLVAGYSMGQFSQVYPLARGTSPWVVAVIATTVLGQRLPPAELVGVLVVSAGLISLVFVGGRPPRSEVPALAAAFVTGLLIATYTVVDGVGVHATSVLSYAAWLFVLQGLAMVLIAFARRGRALPGQLRPALRTGLIGGVVSLVAYGLVLWAQTQGPLAPIAALRETSIIAGAIIGAVFFHERLGRSRTVAAVVVVAGIVLINLG